MSKKCCGIIYKDEKFCSMCGKPLKELPDAEEQVVTEEKTAAETTPKEDSETRTEEPAVLDMSEVEKIAASVLGEAKDKQTGSVEDAKTVSEEQPTGEEDKGEQTSVDEKVDDTPKDKKETKDNEEDAVVEDEDEDEEDEEEDDGTASGGLKFFGVLIILLMLASITVVGLGVYFIFINPFYRNHDINNPVVYEQMATDTDVTNIETRPALVEVSIESETPTDASQEDVATETDATETDATDANATDADVSEKDE